MIITIQLLRVDFMFILSACKCVETTKDYGTTKYRVFKYIFLLDIIFFVCFSSNKLLQATLRNKSEIFAYLQ